MSGFLRRLVALSVFVFSVAVASPAPAQTTADVTVVVRVAIDTAALPKVTGGTYVLDCWTEGIGRDSSGQVSFGQPGTEVSSRFRVRIATGQHGQIPLATLPGQQRSTYCGVSVLLNPVVPAVFELRFDGQPQESTFNGIFRSVTVTRDATFEVRVSALPATTTRPPASSIPALTLAPVATTPSTTLLSDVSSSTTTTTGQQKAPARTTTKKKQVATKTTAKPRSTTTTTVATTSSSATTTSPTIAAGPSRPEVNYEALVNEVARVAQERGFTRLMIGPSVKRYGDHLVYGFDLLATCSSFPRGAKVRDDFAARAPGSPYGPVMTRWQATLEALTGSRLLYDGNYRLSTTEDMTAIATANLWFSFADLQPAAVVRLFPEMLRSIGLLQMCGAATSPSVLDRGAARFDGIADPLWTATMAGLERGYANANVSYLLAWSGRSTLGVGGTLSLNCKGPYATITPEPKDQATGRSPTQALVLGRFDARGDTDTAVSVGVRDGKVATVGFDTAGGSTSFASKAERLFAALQAESLCN